MSIEIFRTFEEARGHFGPCALAIGNFDGVHIGHQALIGEAIRCAQNKHLMPAVLTFDPHPTAVVAPDRVPPLICTMEERFHLLGEVGVQRIFVLQFNAEIARLSPEEFVSSILVDVLETKAVFVGDNFRFGYRQSGTTDVFAALGRSYGFTTTFLKPIEFRGRVVSSTEIRADLTSSKIVEASRLLGRCYSIQGSVVPGRGIGSRKTVPTLNLKPQPELVVPRGIFVTETWERETGRRWPSVTSCGYNPTFGATDLTIETYLLDGLRSSSPAAIEVQFRHFLRQEKTFPTAEALKSQILKDVSRAQAYWRHAENLGKSAPSIY
jgi:riboflavin kinase / FMN adenylyltransferase